MTPEHWQRLQHLFHSSLDLPPQDRAGYLARECGNDGAMRREVEAMVASAGLTDDGLDYAIEEAADRVVSEPTTEHFGPWHVLGLIGRGGMGSVYLAQRDDEYHQRAAIKVVSPEYARHPEALARFRAERQILANLSHPYIAKLLDGGVAGSLPWLAMEYVDGVPIDQFCSTHELSTRERIELVRKVCQAVAHAHQSLVVHRDLKPANVLITADGEPRLLDFGIAKLLEGGYEQMTRASERLLTPEYASPEQVKGEPITTATDVYALGVLLYELVVGKRPWSASSLSALELQNAVCVSEPPRPSTVAKVDADLEHIILKAMRKEPLLRYASATALDDDLGRYLNGYPVEARKGSWEYRAGKFIRRHRAAIAVSILLASALAWGGISTRIAQQRAERRFAEVRELTNRFLFEFHDAIAELPGATTARALLVKRALEYLDRLASERGQDLSLTDELATAYERMRDIQSNIRGGDTGDVADALRSGEKAVQLREEILKLSPTPNARIRLGGAYLGVAQISSMARDLNRSQEQLKRAIEHLTAGLAAAPHETSAISTLLVAYKEEGDVYRMRGESDAALADLRRAHEMAKKLVTEDPNPSQKAVNLHNVASTGISAGDLYRIVKGDLSTAATYYRDAIAMEQLRLPLEPQSVFAQRELALAHSRLGLTLNLDGRANEAQPHLEEALKVGERLSRADPASAMHRRQLSVDQINLGACFLQQKKIEPALQLYRAALAIRQGLYAKDGKVFENRDDLSWAWYRLGTAQAETDPQDANRSFQRSIALRETLAAEYPDRIETQARLGRTYLAAERMFSKNRQCGNARPFYEKARDLYARLKSAGKLEGQDIKDSAEVERVMTACSSQ